MPVISRYVSPKQLHMYMTCKMDMKNHLCSPIINLNDISCFDVIIELVQHQLRIFSKRNGRIGYHKLHSKKIMFILNDEIAKLYLTDMSVKL